MQSKTTRLVFTEEELENGAVRTAARKADKRADKADKAKQKLKTRRRQSNRAQADAGHRTKVTPGSKLQSEPNSMRSVRSRLYFDGDAKEIVSPGGRSNPVIRGSVYQSIHQKVSEYEDDNVAVHGVHQSERMAESAGRTIGDATYSRKLKKYRKAERLEAKADKANVNALFQQSAADNPEISSNLFSKWKQKQAIKKEYMAAKAAYGTTGKTTTTAKGAKKATEEAGKLMEAMRAFVSKNSHVLVMGGVLALLLIIIMSSLSSCTAVFQGVSATTVITSYPSEDADMLAAEAQYCALEAELQEYLDNYESTHDYDEYIYELDDIEHDAYVLISAITALMDGNAWTIDEVQDILQMLFEKQYILTESVEEETRYRTEIRTGTRTVTGTETDPDTGETYEYEYEEEYEYEVQVAYTYYICTVTLENFNLSHVPAYVMSDDQLSLYSVYMITLGNRTDLFPGSSYISLYYGTEYASYEIPAEALTNEQFANMIAEAEKYLGYPYVWGGSSPSTSFDCSGFVSWVINNCGNGWSVGRQSANGLLDLCTVISASEAQPGDLIFFQGTYNTGGASHVGIYVGDGMMIHCGDPIQYTSINTTYWQSHFLAYGRLPGM